MGGRAKTRLLSVAILPALMVLAEAPGVLVPPTATFHRWDGASAGQLLSYLDHIDRQGLVASNYAPERLQIAIKNGDAAMLEAVATRSFALVARDLARGHVPPGQRGRYYIASDPLKPETVADLIDVALARHDVGAALDSLAPQDPQYRMMQDALGRLPAGDTPERRALRVNLERQRWLPRGLEASRLVVNVPEYTLHLFQSGRDTATFRVITGKPKTPTPQFSTQVTGVIFNPPWQVPQSIIAESVGKLVRSRPDTAHARGYVWTYAGGRLRVTQQPGPKNALGQIKLDMPNPLSVYLHDTPDKSLFEKDRRTFSHGCIRTDRPIDLATTLLATTGKDRAAIDSMLTGRTTQRLPLSRPMPIYIIYQTAVAEADGSIRYLGDPYGLDPAVAAALDGAATRPLAALLPTECGPC